MNYIKRDIEQEILPAAKEYPVITITGPRQTGKTTLAKKLFPNLPYYSLENPDIRLFAETDARAFLSGMEKGAILDEVQNVPELFSYIQEIADENEDICFVLTGSNQFSLMQKITQTLAGRTAIFTLLPLTMHELGEQYRLNNIDKYLISGFYPAVYSKKRNPTNLYRNYYATYIERDLRKLINIKNLGLFKKFIRLCAGRIGNLFNASALSNEIGVSVPTINSWVSVLENSYIIFLLQPFYENIGKRLIKTPKIYFYDVGLASYLLSIENIKQISHNPLRGNLFENMIIAELLKYRFNKGTDNNLFFYRDSNQVEIDIVAKHENNYNTFEIKSSQTFHLSFLKNLQKSNVFLQNNISEKYLIYAGKNEFKIKDCEVINYNNICSFW